MLEEAATLPILSEDGEDAAEKSITGLGTADRGRRVRRAVRRATSAGS